MVLMLPPESSGKALILHLSLRLRFRITGPPLRLTDSLYATQFFQRRGEITDRGVPKRCFVKQIIARYRQFWNQFAIIPEDSSRVDAFDMTLLHLDRDLRAGVKGADRL